MSGEGSVLGTSTSILLPVAAGYLTGVTFLYYIAGFFILILGINLITNGIKKTFS